MSRSITLHIEAFGHDALRRTRNDGSRAPVVRTAVLYYLSDGELRRAGWPVPRFLRTATRTGPELEVHLDDETVGALEQEAERQGVSTERLTEHALMYFLADLDSGRVASRLGEELDEL